MGEFGVILGKEAQALALAQLEFVGLTGATGTYKALPFGRTGHVLDVSAGTVIERAVFNQVLGAAAGTFYV
ncbi:MAG: hypothetical protein WCC95_21840 [Candidatus Sulfotelmatobacter sp.]|jgi:hypothetical protein